MAGAVMNSPQDMPGFQPASEIPRRNLSREIELEEKIRASEVEIERLRDVADGAPSGPAAGKPATTGPKPQEWQALQTVISDLLEANRELQATAKKQALQIEDLQKAKKDLQEDIEQIREYFPKLVSEDRARLKALECKPPEENSEISRKRAERIKEYVKENGTPRKFLDRGTGKYIEGRFVRFDHLRSYLDNCGKWQLNRALRALFNIYPGEYCKKKLNKTTWVLVERPKL